MILQSRKSLEILSCHSLRLLVDSQLFFTFDSFLQAEEEHQLQTKKFFLIGLILSHPNFPKWLRTSFFKTPLDSLEFLIYPLKFQTKQSLTPTNSTKLCSPFRSFILRPKTKIPGNFTWFLLDHAWKYLGLVLMFPCQDKH